MWFSGREEILTNKGTYESLAERKKSKNVWV